MSRVLSPAAERLLRVARQRHPDPLPVVGLPEKAAVRELVENNLVIERDPGESKTGYCASIVAIRTTTR